MSTSEQVCVREADTGPGLKALGRALCLVRARVAPDITAQRLAILLAVANHEGLSQRELLQRLEGTSITALSRNLADLSSLTSRKQAGPGLVELRTDPMNLRVKRVHLTERGRGQLRDLERAMAAKAGGDPEN
ncbi:MAG: hypothetical protein P8008_04305 [Gammaproteobacteria bacterium]